MWVLQRALLFGRTHETSSKFFSLMDNFLAFLHRRSEIRSSAAERLLTLDFFRMMAKIDKAAMPDLAFALISRYPWGLSFCIFCSVIWALPASHLTKSCELSSGILLIFHEKLKISWITAQLSVGLRLWWGRLNFTHYGYNPTRYDTNYNLYTLWPAIFSFWLFWTIFGDYEVTLYGNSYFSARLQT